LTSMPDYDILWSPSRSKAERYLDKCTVEVQRYIGPERGFSFSPASPSANTVTGIAVDHFNVPAEPTDAILRHGQLILIDSLLSLCPR
jgi:hypothetical protein